MAAAAALTAAGDVKVARADVPVAARQLLADHGGQVRAAVAAASR